MDHSALDGNAAAGLLSELFAFDATVARTVCSWCGDVHAVAELTAYLGGAGAVLRCSSCGEAQLRLVRAADRAWLDLRGVEVLDVRDVRDLSDGRRAGTGPMDVDRPDVVAEVRAVFERYEAALVGNDLTTLEELFWASPSTVRYGFADVQHGHDEVAAFRRAQSAQSPARTLHDTTISTFGRDAATVTTEFTHEGSTARGRQSQTWVRLDGGWRVVSDHVSWPT